MPKLSIEAQTLRREKILDAAELCFARAGFHATTVQDICRAAGVSAGAVYVYFRSKEELIAGIVQRDRDMVGAQLAAIADAPDFMDGLRQVMQSCILGQPPHKPALFIEIGAESARNPVVARAMNDCDQTLRRALASALTRARGQGRIAGDVDAATVALVMAMLADAMFMRRATDPDFAPETVAPVILQLVAKLLGGDAAAPIPPVSAGNLEVFAGAAE
jgi:TetR/AcrR family transcriptional repressor of uid operon